MRIFLLHLLSMDIIQDKLKVSIAYTLKERSGRILEEVPATYPFVYIHGSNNIIPGLERALEGRSINEKFSVDIPFEQGYGAYSSNLVIEVPKEELQDVGEIWVGMELEMFIDEDIREFQLPDTADEFVDSLNFDEDEQDNVYTIKEIKKDTVIVDGNHPFAGKDLTFDVTVVAIEQASFTEIENGYPDEDDYGSEDNYEQWR